MDLQYTGCIPCDASGFRFLVPRIDVAFQRDYVVADINIDIYPVDMPVSLNGFLDVFLFDPVF